MKLLLICVVVLFASCATTEDKRTAYLKAHPHIPEEHRVRIARGEVIEGMNTEQVRLVLGPPEETYGTSDGVLFWDYRHAKLTFQDGLLVAWFQRHQNR